MNGWAFCSLSNSFTKVGVDQGGARGTSRPSSNAICEHFVALSHCQELNIISGRETERGAQEKEEVNGTVIKKQLQKQTCPELHTSFLNQITFHWFTGLAIRGNRRALEREDLWDLNERDQTRYLANEFNPYFKEELKCKNPQLQDIV